jgi:hypothetical protein
MRYFSSVLLAAAALLSVSPAALADDVFGPIKVGANRSKYTGSCPVDVVFTGNINLNSPHPKGLVVNYHWERSDGVKSPVQVVRPNPQQKMLIVKDPWSIGAGPKHYDISVRLLVNSGNTHLEESSQTVSITCK